MRNAHIWLVIFFFLITTGIIISESTDTSLFTLQVIPSFSVPLGIKNTSLFNYGWGGELAGKLKLAPGSILYLDLGSEYVYLPLVSDDPAVPYFNPNSVSIITASSGTEINWEFLPSLSLDIGIQGGYFWTFKNDTAVGGSGSNGYLRGGMKVSYTPIPALTFNLGAAYRIFFGFYDDLNVTAGISVNVLTPAQSRISPYKGLEVKLLQFYPVFPVFFKYYDDHAIGKVSIRNSSKQTMKDVKVNLFIKEYMDNPKLCIILPKLEAGADADIDLYGLFNNNVMQITEGTKVSLNLSIDSSVSGRDYRNEYIETLRLYDRNAITWDDDQKAAAFVTAKDHTVLKFAKNVSRVITDKALAPGSSINKNFLLAMALHEALTLYGIKYAIDPSSSYIELSKDKLAVDFLQFPNQTLEYLSGDCDDLSILNSALLEALGVETAFITIPGHIFMAFSLDVDPAEAQREFNRKDDLIFIDKTVWMPVEITSIGKGFLEAWRLGAREWRDNALKGQARIYPMHKAWSIYEPVGFAKAEADIKLPDEKKLADTYSAELRKFINQELNPQVQVYEDKIRSNKNNPALKNRLGVLYSRYGESDKAENEFRSILKSTSYIPAMVNLGNVYFLSGEYAKALENYKQAYDLQADNPVLLLNIARTYFELEDLKSAREFYTKLQEKDPELALQYTYLGLESSATDRSADTTSRKGSVLWAEE